MEHYEVAVVGGGPAGSVCAAELAKVGVDVALFDHSHPREKPCGGALTHRVVDRFKIPKNVLERKIDRLLIESPKGFQIDFSYPMGFLVMRKNFDRYLLNHAVKSGAHLISEKVLDIRKENKNWYLNSSKSTVIANFIVGADGCPSLIRKKVLRPIPNDQLGICVGYHIKEDAKIIDDDFGHTVEFYFPMEYINMGYIWIFPKKNWISIGAGTKLGAKNFKENIDKFMEKHAASARIRDVTEKKAYAHLVPFVTDPSFFKLNISGDGWVLIGDAAGHVNPITGEGIYYAMMGGKLAAKAYLDGDIGLFEKYWRKSYGSELVWGSRVKNLFYHPELFHKIVYLSSFSKTLKNTLGSIFTCTEEYGPLFVFKLPLIRGPKAMLDFLFRRK